MALKLSSGPATGPRHGPTLCLRLYAYLRPVWGGEGRGMLWLALGVGATFVLGLLLQVIALRTLAASGYSLFVAALGIGNIANAVASAVQPVVALRSSDARTPFLPASPRALAAAALLFLLAGTVALAPGLGAGAAALALLQIPLHIAVGMGLGRLQRRRAFAPLATCLALWSVARVAVVGAALLFGGTEGIIFVAALPAALLLELLLLVALGAYRGVRWQRSHEAGALLALYAMWALIAWLLNCDVLYARLFLSTADAGAYAVAFTIGRQPVYAAAPLMTVLLPVAAAGAAHEQRARFWAVVGVAALLLTGTMLTVGVAPALFLRLLAGHTEPGLANLVRGYGVVGSLAAAATLLATFVFALGAPARLRALLLIAAASLLAAPLLAHSAWLLLLTQGATVGVLVGFYITCGLRATRTDGGRAASALAA